MMPALKWVVYGGGAALVAAIAVFSGNTRKTFFTVMVLALQADVTLMLVGPTGRSYVGSSGPAALMIPLTVVAAVAALICHRLLAGLRKEQFQWTCGSLTIPGMLSMVTVGMTLLWAPEIRPVIFGLQDSLYGYLLCLAAVNLVRSRADVSRVLSLLMLVLAMQSAVYFVQNLTGVEFTLTGDVMKVQADAGLQRFGGTVSTNPKGFAMFISVLSLLALSAVMCSSNRRLRLRSVPLLAVGIGALALTFTRASWSGFLIGSVAMAIIGLSCGRVKLRRLVVVSTVGVVPILVLLPMILVRLSADHLAAYEERATLMRIAWRIIGDYPLGGVGAGAYGLVMRNYVLAQDWGTWLFIVHNAYLLRWAETGVFGLLSLLGLLFIGFRLALSCARSRDDATAVIGLGCFAGFAHLCWEMWWDIQLGGTTPYLFWFALGTLQAAATIEKRHRTETAVVTRIASNRLRRAVA